ncbi:MAG: response regulator [Gammaproteobacteria bacterium]|jgi:two-component system, OmpR family, phosphate regulon response regulator PhoB|nr:response regulator [Gammaproteobacteria bacterium]MBU0830750.1 response regulator [Gammaproteobacteria bacterium]MBU0893333.1 response regulator [Gammaproteobacteria bacterium]MBU1352280.1 response regulator [Gammaproteobacteria bacterium]MBU1508153.1 response regulator [Gammaproteobacteria bacterium]
MKKILIVEDHMDIRKLLRMTLEFDDFEIHEADTGDAGWAKAQDLRPHMVLLDVMMPGALNGLDVCRLIKNDPRMRHTKVIMLTARVQAADREAGAAAGADDYLMKPFSTLQVLETIYRMEAAL